MLGKAQRKVLGGKLVKVAVDFESHINFVQISGDFFLHPETALASVENCMKGLPIPISSQLLEEKIVHALNEQGAQFVGISPKDLAETIAEALK